MWVFPSLGSLVSRFCVINEPFPPVSTRHSPLCGWRQHRLKKVLPPGQTLTFPAEGAAAAAVELWFPSRHTAVMIRNEVFSCFVFYAVLLVVKMYVIAIITGQVRLRKKARDTFLLVFPPLGFSSELFSLMSFWFSVKGFCQPGGRAETRWSAVLQRGPICGEMQEVRGGHTMGWLKFLGIFGKVLKLHRIASVLCLLEDILFSFWGIFPHRWNSCVVLWCSACILSGLF